MPDLPALIWLKQDERPLPAKGEAALFRPRAGQATAERRSDVGRQGDVRRLRTWSASKFGLIQPPHPRDDRIDLAMWRSDIPLAVTIAGHRSDPIAVVSINSVSPT